MNVIITDWALQSYLDLKKNNQFTTNDYKTILRPDAELLKDGIPSPHTKFSNSSFWGPATDRSGNNIQYGYKMKWHNLGPGNVQLRLAIAVIGGDAFLCRAYVKSSASVDKREMAKLENHIQEILGGNINSRGNL